MGARAGELDRLLGHARDRGLTVCGLMGVPPVDADPRPYFDWLREAVSQHDLAELSMGMSSDFEAAIECGATIVRVGTAIFGPRPT